MQPNHLLNLIGFMMLLFAVTGGIFYKEAVGGSAGLQNWTLEFPVSLGNGPGGSGTATDGQTASATIAFDQVNITTVTFSFSFTDRYRFSTVSPAGATFTVISPLGATGESVLAPGQATATLITVSHVCDVPDQDELRAANLTDAARIAKTRYPANENGTGQWTIEITVTRDYMTPIHPTGSIAWTVTTRVSTYALELSERMTG